MAVLSEIQQVRNVLKEFQDGYVTRDKSKLDESRSLDERLTEATHFGVRRLRDRMRGKGAKWPFVITGVLVKTDEKWGFHTIHWSFPAE